MKTTDNENYYTVKPIHIKHRDIEVWPYAGLFQNPH